MDKIYAITLMALLLVPFVFLGESFAHGPDHSVKKSMASDAQMQKLHAMMPVFSIVLAELESALEKEDLVAASGQTDKILVFVPDLKKSKPHKNIKQRKKFVEHATSLDEAVSSLAVFIDKNDHSGAKTVFKKVEEACAACHAKFRD